MQICLGILYKICEIAVSLYSKSRICTNWHFNFIKKNVLKILIIEDEEGLRESIEEYFTEAGNICETAASYAAALAKVELYRYDCILLDITLPGGNGIDILKSLKPITTPTGCSSYRPKTRSMTACRALTSVLMIIW